MFWRNNRDKERDLERELRSHLEAEANERVGLGVTEQEALRAAKLALGNSPLIQEDVREVWSYGWGSIERTLRTLRHAIKTVIGQRVYLFVIALLALTIGISTAVYSIAEAVMFRPLPFPKQQDLHVISKADPRAKVPFMELAYPELHDLKVGVPGLESIALMPTTLYGYGKVVRLDRDESIQVESAPVSQEFFRTLGVHPALGRDFESSDEHPGAGPVVILSDWLWRSHFRQDAELIGRQVVLNGIGHTVIGIARPDVDFPKGVGLWVPLGTNKELLENRDASFLQAIARAKPGYSSAQLEAQLNGLFKRLARDYPQFYPQTQQAIITPLTRYWIGSARIQFLVSLWASLFLLLTGCIAASNLLLSRTLTRRVEIATRSALGASTRHIFAQFFAEGFTATIFAGCSGLVIAWGVMRLLVSFAPPDIPRLEDATLDWHAFVFCGAVCVFAAISCSAAPILVATKMSLEAALREGGTRLSSARQGTRFQSIFVLVQTATSVLLLTSSTLVVFSVKHMLQAEIGFSHLETVTMNLALRGSQYDAAKRRRVYSRLLDRLRSDPAVIDAAAILVRPMEPIGWNRRYKTEYDGERNVNALPVSTFEVTTPEYFRTVGTPLLEGRDFNQQDREDSDRVVIVSSGLAEKLRPAGHKTLGSRIRLGGDREWSTIIGVAGQAHYRGVTAQDDAIYACFTQTNIPVNYLVIRGRAGTQELVALARKELAAIDSSQAIASTSTIGELVRSNTARERFNMALLVSFGLASLVLTTAGIYSIIAEMVSLRTREIAIRLALGSDRPSLVRRLVTKTMVLVALGEICGLGAALVLARAASSLLYGIKPDDPTLLSAVLCCVFLVSLAAASIPVWTASGRNLRSALG